MPADIEQKVRLLSGLRRTIYYTGISRGLTPEKAYTAASSQCCLPPADASQHAPGGVNSRDEI